jgi:thiol-disulfide isomerase/thioredoxin
LQKKNIEKNFYYIILLVFAILFLKSIYIEMEIGMGMLIALVLVMLVLWWHCQQVVIYKFFRPDCPHCVNLQAEWELFETHLAGTNIRVINVNNNSPESKDLVAKFNVQGVPTIIGITKMGTKVEYSGNRKSSDLAIWADSL